MTTEKQPTIGSYLLDRLYDSGARHIFGIPGDYVLSLYSLIEASPMMHVGTTREDSAGFAADAYARLRGIGVACVTYCVGGLNTVNAIACAYAERSPVVLLSGSPGLGERRRHPFLHHMVKDFDTQCEVFAQITVAAAVLDDPLTAARRIDAALAALQRYKRPIYLEIPRDLVNEPLTELSAFAMAVEESSDPDALAEAVDEVRGMLAAARAPVILVGSELHRFGLHDVAIGLIERLGIPVVSTMLGKSAVPEDHPLFGGVYGHLIGGAAANRLVEESDCCLMLGAVLTDLDEGPGASIPESRAVHATADRVAVKRHEYPRVRFDDFVRALAEADLPPAAVRSLPPQSKSSLPRPADADPATLAGVFSLLDELLGDDMVVIADVGESMFASADLRIHRAAEFLSPAYYTSMGFAVPAAVGAGFAAPHLRPIVLVGDGAFQMTGTELSTCVRFGIHPIVIVLNNRGYSTERAILEGAFNDIHDWRYERICDLVGGGIPHLAKTHGDVDAALRAALADRDSMHVLNVVLDPSDRSPAMQRVAAGIAQRIAASTK
jgi:TPP-dependent 2-oxoacid decarboxylase